MLRLGRATMSGCARAQTTDDVLVQVPNDELCHGAIVDSTGADSGQGASSGPPSLDEHAGSQPLCTPAGDDDRGIMFVPERRRAHRRAGHTGSRGEGQVPALSCNEETIGDCHPRRPLPSFEQRAGHPGDLLRVLSPSPARVHRMRHPARCRRPGLPSSPASTRVNGLAAIGACRGRATTRKPPIWPTLGG